MTDTSNPARGLGDNTPPADAAMQAIMDRLEADYAALVNTCTQMCDSATELPAVIETSEQLAKFAATVQEFRELAKRVESTREQEKAPYLAGGRAVDGFFFRLSDAVLKSQAAVNSIITTFKQRQLAEERERLRREQEQARQREEAARRAIEEANRKAREAQEAAAKARKAETFAKHQEEAARQAEAAEEARVNAMIESQRAEEAATKAMEKPTHTVGERFKHQDRGGRVGMRQTPHVVITDPRKLNKETLWPFIKDEHLLQALKMWARTTSHKQPMDGAVIELRDNAEVR